MGNQRQSPSNIRAERIVQGRSSQSSQRIGTASRLVSEISEVSGTPLRRRAASRPVSEVSEISGSHFSITATKTLSVAAQWRFKSNWQFH